MQHLILFAGKSGVLRKYVEKLRNFPVLLPVETYAKRFIRPSKRFGWKRLQSQGSMAYQNMVSSSYHGHAVPQGEISRFVLCILWDIKSQLETNLPLWIAGEGQHQKDPSVATISSVDAAVYQNAKLQRGTGMEVSKAFKLQEYHKTS
jgi:hypothetical protein